MYLYVKLNLHIYPLLCRGHSWRVRLAKQETLTPPGHLVSPLVCRGPWMSTVVLYCWCHSDSASVLLYFTLDTKSFSNSTGSRDLYELRKLSARLGTQFVRIGMTTVCWKTFPAKFMTMFWTRNSKILIISSLKDLCIERDSFFTEYDSLWFKTKILYLWLPFFEIEFRIILASHFSVSGEVWLYKVWTIERLNASLMVEFWLLKMF